MKTPPDVYITGISSVLPKVYPNTFIIDTLYSEKLSSEKVRKFARLSVLQTGIKNRPSILDFHEYPPVKLLCDEYTSQNWGRLLLNDLLKYVDLPDIGYLNVTYDVSAHKKHIPNLACQIAMENHLKLIQMPDEIAHYGCGSGLLALRAAIDFCRKKRQAALVFAISQCTWLCNPVYDPMNVNFRDSLKANLIFGDGAVGLLLVPENMINEKHKNIMKIIDIDVGFELGDEIKMTKDGIFIVNDSLKDILPGLVSRRSVFPILERHRLSVDQIEEWSVHQGGITILEKFKEKEILGLTDEQIQVSRKLFENNGNLSTISSLLVLQDFFKREEGKDRYGMVVSFGSGYYFGAMLYKSINLNSNSR